MGISLTILGFNSAIPTEKSNPTAQYLNIAERHFLIDCGEGTQVQLRKAKIKFSQINHIFISHLHGDHFFGLIGLLSTLQLLGRTSKMTIFGPKGIKDIIEIQLKYTSTYEMLYSIDFVELTSVKSELIFEDTKITVHTIPLSHRIYTNGFLFKEKIKERKLNMDSIVKHNLKHQEITTNIYSDLKQGKNFEQKNGKIIANKKLTLEPERSVSYAFCSDTKYEPSIIPIIRNVDLLYHEATFLNDMAELAEKTAHSTALQAAEIALSANVGRLILGHFSNRYTDFNVLKEEAQQLFPFVELAQELLQINI